MLRRLITLFALVSGLAAIGVPVQARAASLPGVDLVSPAQLAAKCAQDVGKRNDDPKRPVGKASRDRKPCAKPSGTIVYFPPVMLRIDRSRE